mgnify:CR=1 FL=1
MKDYRIVQLRSDVGEPLERYRVEMWTPRPKTFREWCRSFWCVVPDVYEWIPYGWVDRGGGLNPYTFESYATASRIIDDMREYDAVAAAYRSGSWEPLK